MKLKNNLKYVTVPLKIGITVLILLLVICFLQLIVYQVGTLFIYKSYESTVTEDPDWRIPRANKNFLPDGTIHLVHTPGKPVGRGEYRQDRIYDVNDNLLWEGIRKDMPYEYLSWAGTSNTFFRRGQIRNLQRISPDLSRMLEIPVSSQERTEEVWRYEPELTLFVGYEIGGDRIGYIGSAGFTKSQSQAKAFGQFGMFTAWVPLDSFSPMVLWQTNRSIYEINFEKQKVEILFESPGADIKPLRLHHWKPLSADKSQAKQIKYRPLIYCQSEDGKHHLIMRNPRQKVTFVAPEDWRADSVKVTATEEDIFLHHKDREAKSPEGISRPSFTALQKWWRQFNSKPQKMWVELYRVGNSGSLELLNHFKWTRPATTEREQERFDRRFHTAVMKISPVAYDLVWYLFEDKLEHHARQGSGISREYAQIIREFRPGKSVVNVVLSVLMVGFVLWHGWPRRTSWAGFVFWLVVVGLFNLAGLLTYLALNHSAVVTCKTCGNKRGLKRVDCVRCGAELPLPQRREVDLIFNS